MTSPEDAERRLSAPDFLTELFRNPLDPGYADAARRRARDGEPTGWRKRLVSAVSALTVIAVGFLLVVAYRQTASNEPARTQARSALVEQVQRRRADTDGLQVRADQLRGEVTTLRERELGGAAAARLRGLEAAAGQAKVRGDGARVRLSDGPTPINPSTGLRDNDARVKDIDIQVAANALWAGGAEAIAVNDQRLTATARIRQAGEAILIDDRPVASPYEISAIGPDDLADTFRASDAGRLFRRLVTDYGMSFDVAPADDLTLPAAAEPKLRYAKPAVEPSGSPSGSPTLQSPSGTSGTFPSDGAASTVEPLGTPSEGG